MDIAKKIYRTVRPIKSFSGRHSKNWWATRDATETNSSQGYWDGRTHPARGMIADVVADLPGISLLEVGIHAGPTTWAICQKKRFQKIAGTELSETVLAFTREHLPAALDQPVQLECASADALPFPDKSFDITVTNLVLVCIGPEDIKKSLSEILRVTRGYLVIGEPSAASAVSDTRDLYPNTTYWIRNYSEALAGRANLVNRVEVPLEFQLGHLDEIAIFKVIG